MHFSIPSDQWYHRWNTLNSIIVTEYTSTHIYLTHTPFCIWTSWLEGVRPSRSPLSLNSTLFALRMCNFQHERSSFNILQLRAQTTLFTSPLTHSRLSQTTFWEGAAASAHSENTSVCWSSRRHERSAGSFHIIPKRIPHHPERISGALPRLATKVHCIAKRSVCQMRNNVDGALHKSSLLDSCGYCGDYGNKRKSY